MDADVSRYLDHVLGARLIAGYAAGSLALDAYLPGRSDIDIALISDSALPDFEKHQLVAALRHDSIPCPARGLELVLYRKEVAASGTTAPGFEVELNTGSRMDFRATYAGHQRAPADGLFWYALDRSILREHGLTMFGPPPGEMFGEISGDDLRSLLVASLRWWLALPMPTGNEPSPGADDAVLGACRALVRQRTGRWLAKEPAGRELAGTGYQRPLIEQAIAARHGGPSLGAADARRFQESVLNEIERGR